MLIDFAQLDFTQPVMIVVLVMAGIFFFAFFSLLFIWLEFIFELGQLRLLTRLVDDLIHGFRESQNVYEIVFSRLKVGTLVYERFELIASLMMKKITPNLTEISDLTLAKKEAELKTQMVNFALAVLLIIGLGGTFWAFKDILTNSGLNRVLSDGQLDPSKYQAAIETIYTGFQNAFWASLGGILGTVLLLFVKFIWVNPLREHFFAQLDWVTQARLIPLFAKPEKTDRIEEMLFTAATKFDSLLTNLHTFSRELKETLSPTTHFAVDLHHITEQMRETTERFQHITDLESPFFQSIHQLYEVVNQVHSRYGQLSGDFGQLLQQNQEFLEQHKEQNRRTAKAQKGLHDIQQQLEKYLGQVSHDFKSIRQQHEQTLTGLNYQFTQQINEFLTQQTVQLNENTKKIMEESVPLVGHLRDLLAALTIQQTAYANDFGHALHDIATMMEKLESATQQLNGFITQVNHHAQELIPQLSHMGLTALMNQIDRHAQEVQTTLENNLQGLMERVNKHTDAVILELNETDGVKHIEHLLRNWPDYSLKLVELTQLLEGMQDLLKISQRTKGLWNLFGKHGNKV